jgi:hypothetical protein
MRYILLTTHKKSMAHNKTTGRSAASAASNVLRDPRSTKIEKSAAASALSQRQGKRNK